MFHFPLNPSLSYGKTEAIFPSFNDPNILNPQNTTTLILDTQFHVPTNYNLPHNDHTFLYSSSPSEQYQITQCLIPYQTHHGNIALNDSPWNYYQENNPTANIVYDCPMVFPVSTGHHDDHKKKGKEKKPGASDRHSKIAVKNRLRHRRTRLSIDVARQLFELQDMLNFERASKAVEWLLVRARPDIAKLRRELNPDEGCDVIVAVDHRRRNCHHSANSPECDAVNSGLDDDAEKEEKKKKKKHRRPSKTRCPVAKEAREMARKRARERTSKKRSLTTPLPTNNNSWQSMESVGFHEQLTQQPGVNNLVLPDDLLFNDIIGMSFEMATI